MNLFKECFIQVKFTWKVFFLTFFILCEHKRYRRHIGAIRDKRDKRDYRDERDKRDKRDKRDERDIRQQLFEGKWSVSPYFLHHYQDNNEAGMLLVDRLSLKTLSAYISIIFWLQM